jgi:Tol biopolymer transport system component/tRNA A-37 threonylcarbamoyl transferase component Bud32
MDSDELGHFSLLEKIGEGGMGRVYKARDKRLARFVAIKVLSEARRADADRRARFVQEAKAASALNHPNIITIHEVGEQDGKTFIVVELVDGKPLNELIPRKGMRLTGALRIAAQVADALTSAHAAGIVHRDLKPANIMVDAHGRVKVLDFGLAKLFATAAAGAVAADESTKTVAMDQPVTEEGVILGSIPYMSPEQAEGRPVDARSDIFSFGAVLYEMITGQRAFRGESRAPTLAAVVEKDPQPPSESSSTTPPELDRLVARCLRKDINRRSQNMADVKLALEELRDESESGKFPRPAAAPVAGARRWVWQAAVIVSVLIAAAAAMALLAAPGWGVFWRARQSVEQPLIRLNLDLGSDDVAGKRFDAVISPDARRIAYLVGGPDGRQRIATRLLDQPNASVLSGTEVATNPFFSPDGQWLGFFADFRLKKIPVRGGTSLALCDAPNGLGASWGDDNNIIVAPHIADGLYRVPAEGGVSQPVTRLLNDERAHAWPQILPGGEAVLFTSRPNSGGASAERINVLSLRTGRTKVVWRGGSGGRYLPSGHLAFVQQGTLSVVAFDLQRLETLGSSVPLLDDVYTDSSGRAPWFDVAQNGTLIYLSRKQSDATWTRVWVDRAGKTQPLAAEHAPTGGLRISPDGKLVVWVNASSQGSNLWLLDLARARETPLTLTTSGNGSPLWAPDGKHLVFSASTGKGAGRAIWWMRADGASQPLRLLEVPEEVYLSSISRDGRRIAFQRRSPGTGYDIWTLPLDVSNPDRPVPGEPELFLRTAANEWDANLSPNGRWVAYFSDEQGTGVYVRSFHGPGGPWLIASGANRPKWSPDGRTLYYSSSDQRIMELAYSEKGDSFLAEKARRWSDSVIPYAFDMSSDGNRILTSVLEGSAKGQDSDSHVTLLLNFVDEVRRRVPHRGR